MYIPVWGLVLIVAAFIGVSVYHGDSEITQKLEDLANRVEDIAQKLDV
jgi:hypothetical protein